MSNNRRQEHKAAVASMSKETVIRLAKLGIYPDALAGRLRLVLVIGCSGDFRFTRDILSTGAAHERLEEAVQALEGLGAHCDCEVFKAICQLPRGIFRHDSGIVEGF